MDANKHIRGNWRRSYQRCSGAEACSKQQAVAAFLIKGRGLHRVAVENPGAAWPSLGTIKTIGVNFSISRADGLHLLRHTSSPIFVGALVLTGRLRKNGSDTAIHASPLTCTSTCKKEHQRAAAEALSRAVFSRAVQGAAQLGVCALECALGDIESR